MKLLFTILILSFLSCFLTKAEQIGKASWYSISTNGGTTTASGKKLKNNEMTAAHRTLPFGTVLKVTNMSNGKSVNCVVSDRGPYLKGRIVDVTIGAAEALGFRKKGITNVRIEVMKKGGAAK